MIQIKHLDGSLVLELEIPEGASVHRELMGEHYMRMQFSLEKPVYLKLGDYVQTNFGRFELTSPYSPKYNTTTDGYDYDLQLDAYYIKLRNKKCKYNPKNAASETSFHLTAPLSTHLNVILQNINAIAAKDSNFKYSGKDFVYQFKGVDETKANSAKYKQYQNTDIISALNEIAGIFDCEWWVEDNIINVGRCEIEGSAVKFEVNENVLEMRSSESKNEYATRVFAFGSTRNLPKDYRKDSSADITQNGVVQKRLMLPLADCPNGYLQDADVKDETGAVEAVVIDEDIFPRTKCKVSKVETYTSKVKDKDTGEEVEQTFYRLTDGSGLNFSTDFILEGETLHILFQSGKMNGMDFECQYNDEKKYYEVVVNEDYGRPLPDTSLHPEVGDDFVLYNWDSTKIGNTGLVEAAEKELKDAIQKKLDRKKVDPNTYTCKMNSYWYEENRKASATGDATTMNHYSMGQKVELVNASSFEKPRQSRIIGYDIKLDIEYDTPEYLVGEATVYSQAQDLQSQIDSITVNGLSYTGGNGGGGGGQYIYIITADDSATESDTNVYSAARVQKQYADKLHDEQIKAMWTLLNGLISKGNIEVGDYVSGYFGQGALIDTKGNVEVESLFSRSFISTPEFRFNRISVTEGENWCTNGFGTIAEVDTEAQTITLKLEENEYASVKVGDICRGMYNDFENRYNTATSDKDECGFSSKEGYFTSYFTITEMVKNVKGECVFKYQLRNASTPQPCKFMKFAQYGSFTDESRQSSSYSTSIGHYYEEVLEGVNTWVISDPHIVYRHGWLGTMRVTLRNGETAQLQGNGLYVQDNVYFGNAIVQLDPVTLSDLQKQLELYTVEFSDYTDVVTVDAVGNVIGGLYKCDRNGEGEIVRKYDYRIHSAIYVKRGNDFLTLADAGKDAGNGTYKIYTQCDGCTCVVENSTIYITSIKDVKDGVAGTADDTDFDYEAMRNRESILVTVTIDCEGIGTISRAFPVAIKHDSQPFIGADIENEFSGISWNTKEQTYIGLPIAFKFRMWHNNEMLDVNDIAISGLEERYWSFEGKEENGVFCQEIKIYGLPKDFPAVTNINITGTCEYAGISYERTLVHTINKTTDTNVYRIEPSETSVHITHNDVKQPIISASKVFCNVVCNSTEDEHYIVAPSDFDTHGISLKYMTKDTEDNWSEEKTYTSTGVPVSVGITLIKFALYIEGGATIYENVPVMLDGLDGDNSIRLALDNENDNCLALEDGTVIESTLPVTHAALFDGDNLITPSQHATLGNTWQTLICTGCTAEYGNYNSDGWREIKVKSVSAITAQVVVPCKYTSHGVTIETKAILSIKKDVGTDKYEIITNPASVAYNPNSDTFTPEQVAVSVYKTTRETPRTLLTSFSSSFKLYYSTDGGVTWTALRYGDAITKGMFNANGVESIQIKLVETVTKNGLSTSVIRDLEAVDIVGDGLDGKGIEHVFFCWDSETKPSIYNDSHTLAFQNDDYCPYTDSAHSARWTDEPTGVGANAKYEYYAMRKKVNGVWQPFGTVKIWNRYTLDGSSPYMIDLSNDQSLVNCEDDGTVIGTYEPTEIMLFKGDKDAFDDFDIEITATNISYSRSGRVITPRNISSDAATIAVKATSKTNTSIYLTAVYSINKAYKGKDGVIYSLVPSVSAIKKNKDNAYVDAYISMQVKKTVGNAVSMLTTKAELTAEGLALKFKYSGTYYDVSDPSNIKSQDVCITSNYADFYLFQGSTVIDREKINCVQDGKTGDKGDDGDDGEDAYNINISNLNIVGTEGTAKEHVIQISVKKGDVPLPYGIGTGKWGCESLGDSTIAGGIYWWFETPNTYTFQYHLVLNGTKQNEDIPFYIEIEGVKYNYVIHVTTAERGIAGQNGFSLVNRGVWNENGYYPNNNGYSFYKVGDEILRDEVIHTIGNVPYVFMVKNRTDATGTNVPITSAPTLDSNDWEVGTIYQLLFANCLFAENANVGGFIVNNLLMKSQSVAYRVLYYCNHSISRTYTYLDSDSTADGVPARMMVKYEGKYYVVLKLGSSVPVDSSNPILPTDTRYWREATAEEYRFAESISDIKASTAAIIDNKPYYTEIPVFRLDGVNGTITMRQADDTEWTYDTTGKHIMGVADGQRLELDPKNKDIRIFNDAGDCTSIFEGNSYNNMSTLYGNSSGTLTVSNASGSPAYAMGVNEGDAIGRESIGTRTLSSFTSATPTEVTINLSLQCEADSYAAPRRNESNTQDMPLKALAYARAQIYVRVITYEDSTMKKRLESVTLGSCVASASADNSAPLYDDNLRPTDYHEYKKSTKKLTNAKAKVVAGYHVIELEYRASCTYQNSQASCKWGNDCDTVSNRVPASLSYNSEFYVSRFFANGFTLGVRADNMVAAYRDTNGMNFIAQNGDYGIKVLSTGVQVRIGATWKTLSIASDGTVKAT